MKDTLLLNKLWKEVEAGRVSVSQSGGLSIFKYTQETHIKNLWNETNRHARGIIFAADGTIVARPFEKFFNLGECPQTQVDNLPWHENVEVYEKMDGSCGIGYFGMDGPSPATTIIPINTVLGDPIPMWRLATPGSMESDQAIEGTRILNEWVDSETGKRPTTTSAGWSVPKYDLQYLPTDCTPVFEIIYPENRIVVDYAGETFLSLLAIFEHNGVEWHPRRVDQIVRS
jgi:RNA ligase